MPATNIGAALLGGLVTAVVLYSLGTWLYWHWFHGVESSSKDEPEPLPSSP